MTTRIASCSCGQLTATTRGDPVRVGVCHCLNCQRRSGSAFSVQARFLDENVELSGESKQFVLVGDGGTRATFHFCPECGATVHFSNEGREGSMLIPVGAFAEPGFPAPSVSVYDERMHSWVSLLGDMEHWA